MSRIDRQSKFRHVFGTANKKEFTYDNVKVSKSAWDSNKVKGNGTFVGIMWEARGGGSFAVLPNEQFGKVPADQGLVTGHKGAVLDIDFNPFNDHVVGSVSEDGNARIWLIPEGGLGKSNLNDPAQNLIGHRRKVGTIDFNPTANNVVATSSADMTVKVWDITTGDAKLTIGNHTDIITCAAWNRNGSLVGTTCKDKKARIFDPRSGNVTLDVVAHAGVKGMRCTFLGDRELFATVGFGKTSDRQLAIWDARAAGEPLHLSTIDTASGILMPFYDNDTGIFFLGGKGDGNIRYYEIVNDSKLIYYISEYKSATPQLGMALRPKTACDVSKCEVVAVLKACVSHVEPISFQVPRKSALFQDDIYPPTADPPPGVQPDGWFAGQTGEPVLASLEGGFVPPERPAFEVAEVKAVDDGPQTEAELRKAYEDLKNRVAYLEVELSKKDLEIQQLRGQ